MGLTIHFEFKFQGTSAAALTVVETLFATAEQQKFPTLLEVTTVLDPPPDEEYPGGFIGIFSIRYLHKIKTPLRELHAFVTDPGEGSESAEIGLARFDEQPGANGEYSWFWNGFCKTQYASDPRHGGIENFLRCHLGLVAIFDRAGQIPGMQVRVVDESDYWDHRDLDKLVQQINRWNQMIAAFAGKLKDHLPGQVTGPILENPRFEHLEAEGVREWESWNDGNDNETKPA
ncbi:MAG: hypothetical protein SFX18_03590 [Pirellulales bacterium]|nr:hypothetical protein [Pirellulales bacterium]